MRAFPFIIPPRSMLAEVMRAARADPRGKAVCGFCSGRMPVSPDRAEQEARCPHCWRVQHVGSVEEFRPRPTWPWR